MAKSVSAGEGEACPKCGEVMKRFRHPNHWRPRPGQPYHFSRWDFCEPCRHLQHYEQFKVWDISGERKTRMETAIHKQIEAKRGLASGELVLWGETWGDVPSPNERPPWE